jgi:hypothetical protein
MRKFLGVVPLHGSIPGIEIGCSTAEVVESLSAGRSNTSHIHITDLLFLSFI